MKATDIISPASADMSLVSGVYSASAKADNIAAITPIAAVLRARLCFADAGRFIRMEFSGDKLLSFSL